MEGRDESVRFSLQNTSPNRRLHLLVHHQDYDSPLVYSSPPCSPTHLYVLSTRQKAKILPVKLSYGSEDNCFGRHIQTHRKCFCCKESLYETFLEKYFYHLLYDWKQTTVVYPCSPFPQKSDQKEK